MHWSRTAILAVVAALFCRGCRHEEPFRRDIDFNPDWRFKRCDSVEESDERFALPDWQDEDWELVTLPHTPRIEPLLVNDMFQGICWYRKHFRLDPKLSGRRIFLEFEGAMTVADVSVNGRHKLTHFGGYLPFTIDITEDVRFGAENVVAIRLDNRDNPGVPPGKPLRELDFCWYGGLYRNVKLHVLNPLHITDPIYARKVGGGGVFVRLEDVSEERAIVWVQTHVVNQGTSGQRFRVVHELRDGEGKTVSRVSTGALNVKAGADTHLVQRIPVSKPRLWYPDRPYLYRLCSRVVRQDGMVSDELCTRVGIRTIAVKPDGFWINGRRLYLRGANRHQEHPYVGYAVPDNAQRRDAIRIKRAGFDFVRLSHYPQSTAFLDACDELGLLVMDAIPGWQFLGDAVFRERAVQCAQEMVRRDRNHPSVVLWEVSLNETWMDRELMEALHRAAHEEYPGDQCYTAGWISGVYDVFLQARQHGGCHDVPPEARPCLVSEYGDWEYYAQNAGLDQPGFRDLKPSERNSRQRRGDGERRLLQQAMNFQEAHNDNLSTCAIGDAVWVMFDYNRGYDNTIEASGVMDIFRLPKFSYSLFRSQREAGAPFGEPMVFLATYWTEHSPLKLKVFSNCEEVRLSLNGRVIGSRGRERDRFSDQLPAPPFVFELDHFEPGTLEAVGFLGGRPVAFHTVSTPQAPMRISLEAALEGIPPASGRKDLLFLHARIEDARGSLVPTAGNLVHFEVMGPARLIGENPIAAEAGIASILLETTGEPGIVEVKATSEGLYPGNLKLRVGR
jgi:beta-galactosidase